jgi:hypothetical protein
VLDLNQIPALFPRTDLHVGLVVGPEEFLRNLRGSVSSAERANSRGDRLEGAVAADGIRIRRVRPFLRNDFAPQFTGSLSEDGLLLEGSFEAALIVRRFLRLWLAGTVLFVILAVLPSVEMEGSVLVPLFMFAVGAMVPRLGWWFGRGDRDRIEAALMRAAGHPDG